MMPFLLAVNLFAAPAAHAGDQEDDLHENTVGGARGPEKEAALDVPVVADDSLGNHPYSPLTVKAAEVLRLEIGFADRCRKAIDGIYARRYKESKAELDKLTVEYPTTGIGPAGSAVIYQALMFENFDFRYERQYRSANDAALRQIAAGKQVPGNEAIESFLLAGMEGISAIHHMRRAEFLAALSDGVDAVRALAEVKAAAPAFVDPVLGDGMYLYWRTVIARATPLLPDGADDREEGKRLIKQVEKDGVLMSPAATLALTYSYIEERDLKNALARTMYGRTKYPDNVINNMTAGRVLAQMRRYDDAISMYRSVLTTAPDNQRTHYHLGVVYARQSKHPDAERELRAYINFKDAPADFRGQAWYRLGLVFAAQQRTPDAKWAYEHAVSVGKNEAARRALAKLR
ncbi:MAG: tetratricopeptide repeat protein [Myxococcales bacterium]|nr:tetratricopeptide repeat protein [Myxococcales bacterium]